MIPIKLVFTTPFVNSANPTIDIIKQTKKTPKNSRLKHLKIPSLEICVSILISSFSSIIRQNVQNSDDM